MVGEVVYRSKSRRTVQIGGRVLECEVVEIPFREGVELRCKVGAEEIRVSDRGLGEHEAVRLLEEELLKRGLI